MILYVSHSAGLYGAEFCLLNLLTSLDKSCFLPIVAVPENGPLTQELEALNIAVEVIPSIKSWLTRRNGVQRFLYLLITIPFIFISTWRLKRIVARYEVDLIHTNTSVIISGALAAWKSGIPHVWHVRELLIPETIFNFFLGPRVALSIITRLADQVIAISSGVRRTFCDQGDSSKVVVVYDGIEFKTSESPRAAISIRSELGIPADDLLIGEIGRVSEIKGYEDFIRAATMVKKAIPNTSFIGVGGRTKSETDYEQRMLRLIASESLQGSFKLIGYREDISDIMSALDLLVLPSRSEALGRVLIEAMAAGKPVIGTQIGGIPEVIENGITGLVIPPCSPHALAHAIIRILGEPNLAHRMGTAGHEKAMVRFNLERHVAEVQCIYKGILGVTHTAREESG